jgi:hypothetical protein
MTALVTAAAFVAWYVLIREQWKLRRRLPRTHHAEWWAARAARMA